MRWLPRRDPRPLVQTAANAWRVFFGDTHRRPRILDELGAVSPIRLRMLQQDELPRRRGTFVGGT